MTLDTCIVVSRGYIKTTETAPACVDVCVFFFLLCGPPSVLATLSSCPPTAESPTSRYRAKDLHAGFSLAVHGVSFVRCGLWGQLSLPPPLPPPRNWPTMHIYCYILSSFRLFVWLVPCLLPYHAQWAKLSLFCFPRWLRGVVAPVLAWLLGDRLRHWLHVRRGDRVKRRAISRWRFPRRVFLWLRRSCEPAMSSADERAGSCMPVRLGSVVRRKICVTSSGNIVGSWWS